jgi:hypothetical protein
MNRALLVGINNYPSANNQLHGCINDVNDMASFLVSSCGFAYDDIRLVTDERATAKNILDRIGWLLTGVNKGDRILFHYSGHGAQVPSRNPQGQTDQVDESICPVDFNFDDDTTMIRDKDFLRVFGSVPEGVEFVWVSDSCFSGGLTRAMVPKPINVTRLKDKSFTLPADIAWRARTAAGKNIQPLGLKGAAKRLHVALISGCTKTQESADADINARPNGALTYYLLTILKGATGLTLPLTGVVDSVVNALKQAGFTQHPELLGSESIGEKAFLQP